MGIRCGNGSDLQNGRYALRQLIISSIAGHFGQQLVRANSHVNGKTQLAVYLILITVAISTGFGYRVWVTVISRKHSSFENFFTTDQKGPGKRKISLGLQFYRCTVFPISFAPLVRRSTDRFDGRFLKMDNM